MIKTSHLVLAGAVIAAALLAMVYMSLDREVVLPPEPKPAQQPAPPAAAPPSPVGETPSDIIEVPVRLIDWSTDRPVVIASVNVQDFRGNDMNLRLVNGETMWPIRADGSWCFKINAAGYYPLTWCFHDYLDIAGGQATGRAELYLTPGHPRESFEITAEDGLTGDPIEGAAIAVLDVPSPGMLLPESLAPVATTDRMGKALLEQALDRLFVVSKEHYASSIIRYKPALDTVVKLYMLTGVQGRLLDNGVPAAGKLAPELLVDDRASILVTAPQSLQPDGSFKWTDLAPGLYAMRILREGGERWGTFPVTVTGGVVSEVSPDLKDFGQLEGLASLLAPGRVIHAELALVTAPDRPLYRVPVDDTGAFRFAHVPADTYLVRLVDEEGNERHITHPVMAGEMGNIRLAAPAASE